MEYGCESHCSRDKRHVSCQYHASYDVCGAVEGSRRARISLLSCTLARVRQYSCRIVGILNAFGHQVPKEKELELTAVIFVDCGKRLESGWALIAVSSQHSHVLLWEWKKPFRNISPRRACAILKLSPYCNVPCELSCTIWVCFVGQLELELVPCVAISRLLSGSLPYVFATDKPVSG